MLKIYLIEEENNYQLLIMYYDYVLFFQVLKR